MMALGNFSLSMGRRYSFETAGPAGSLPSLKLTEQGRCVNDWGCTLLCNRQQGRTFADCESRVANRRGRVQYSYSGAQCVHQAQLVPHSGDRLDCKIFKIGLRLFVPRSQGAPKPKAFGRNRCARFPDPHRLPSKTIQTFCCCTGDGAFCS
jgi:hypothetical protein